MDQSLESMPLHIVRQVITGTKNRRQTVFRRRKKQRSLPWEEESDTELMQKSLKNGHVDLRC